MLLESVKGKAARFGSLGRNGSRLKMRRVESVPPFVGGYCDGCEIVPMIVEEWEGGNPSHSRGSG